MTHDDVKCKVSQERKCANCGGKHGAKDKACQHPATLKMREDCKDAKKRGPSWFQRLIASAPTTHRETGHPDVLQVNDTEHRSPPDSDNRSPNFGSWDDDDSNRLGDNLMQLRIQEPADPGRDDNLHSNPAISAPQQPQKKRGRPRKRKLSQSSPAVPAEEQPKKLRPPEERRRTFKVVIEK